MLLGLLTALYFQRRCHVTRRDRQLGLQLPLICRKAAQLWSCQESRSQSLSLTHTSTDCTKRTWLQKRPPQGNLKASSEALCTHIHNGHLFSFHLSSWTNTRTHPYLSILQPLRPSPLASRLSAPLSTSWSS